MKAIADFCIVPLGVGVSVSEYIAACELVLEEAGLKRHMHAYGTNIEGDWDEGIVNDCDTPRCVSPLTPFAGQMILL